MQFSLHTEYYIVQKINLQEIFLEDKIMEEDYVISKEEFKNVFNGRVIISKEEFLDYMFFREEKVHKIITFLSLQFVIDNNRW